MCPDSVTTASFAKIVSEKATCRQWDKKEIVHFALCEAVSELVMSYMYIEDGWRIQCFILT